MNENEEYSTIIGFRDDKSNATIHISTSAPTPEDGENGDIWLVYEDDSEE